QMLELTRKRRGDAAARLAQRFRGLEIRDAGGRVAAFKLRDAFVAALEIAQLATQRIAPGDDVGQRRAVLALYAFEKRQPFLDLLQARRRGLDGVRVAPEKQRQVLELPFDAVARVQIRLESRIERRELADAAPDRAKPCE